MASLCYNQQDTDDNSWSNLLATIPARDLKIGTLDVPYTPKDSTAKGTKRMRWASKAYSYFFPSFVLLSNVQHKVVQTVNGGK